MAAFTFEAQHRIDHMFEHARTGDGAVLGDMPDQDQGGAAILGVADQFLCRCAHLADRAGGTLDQIRVHRLDRIDDQQGRRRTVVERGEDVAYRRGGRKLHRRLPQPHPPRAQPHLIGRFLARDIGHMQPGQRHLRRSLEQQGRLADTGIAADQGRRRRDQPAAERAIELGNARREPGRQRHVGIEPGEHDRSPARPQIMLRGEGRDDATRFLNQRIPVAAIDALALPFARDASALLADVAALRLGHSLSLLANEAGT